MSDYRVIGTFIWASIILVLFSCRKVDTITSPELSMIVIPEGFPNIEFPEDNDYSKERWLLGKKLFYDPIMSNAQDISCASCHLADRAFSDTVALSKGDQSALGTQNAPTLTNVAYHPYFTRAGGVPSLEMQVLVPIQEHNEFNTNILDIIERLKNDDTYVQMSYDAYDRAPDAFVITRALATFERSLISGTAPYDLLRTKGDSSALSASALRGLKIFTGSRAQCSKCHEGFNFTNYAFENNGLYENYSDLGRKRFTRKEEDLAKFKVPTLRNIAVTAPYMHDGSMASLAEVIEHYNSGGKNHPSKNSNLIKPLHLSEQEKADLESFLISLTDDSFIKNINFKK